jgi:pimeloyl-ACP methyl ester carboxylesterase
VVVDSPAVTPAGIALVAHPHPLYGGTLENKVVHTLARAFVELGCVAVRPNFRGVGDSEGAHDAGVGEVDDLDAALAWAQSRFGPLPVHLAGYSFGSAMQTQLAERLRQRGTPVARLVLVGTAVTLNNSATGGTPPYTWSATGLPPGLSISASTGQITGTPTTVGTYSVTVSATGGATRSVSFTWTVNPVGGSCPAEDVFEP